VPRSVLSRTPRKPMTAYNVFYKIAYAELSAVHPEATLSQLSQMCSDRWKSLSEDEKRPYYDDAGADRARYRQELLDYQNGPRGGARGYAQWRSCDSHRGGREGCVQHRRHIIATWGWGTSMATSRGRRVRATMDNFSPCTEEGGTVGRERDTHGVHTRTRLTTTMPARAATRG
jgi:hypothetical protein